MIDWNNNGKIDPVDVGISIATSQDNETDEARNGEEKRLSLLDGNVCPVHGICHTHHVSLFHCGFAF